MVPALCCTRLLCMGPHTPGLCIMQLLNLVSAVFNALAVCTCPDQLSGRKADCPCPWAHQHQ
jgi:hypothetical protein